MFRPLSTLSALALALSTSLALAQEAAAPAAETSPAAPPQVGETYLSAQHGDWTLRCLKTEEGQADPCQMYQLLEDSAGNSVAEITLFTLPEGGEAVAGANIVAPLETLLTVGILLQIDAGDALTYPFTFCNRGGCVARAGFTAGEIAQLKRGKEATLSVVPVAAPDTPVPLSISLTGFTAAYTALSGS